MQELVFSDLVAEFPVTIGKKRYMLREASADAVVKFRNALTANAQLGQGGRVSRIGNIADAEPLLVSLCIVELYDHDTGKGVETKERPVPLSVVRSWPNRILKPLFDKVKEISAIHEDEETEESLGKEIARLQGKLDLLRKDGGAAKNGQKAMTDISA